MTSPRSRRPWTTSDRAAMPRPLGPIARFLVIGARVVSWPLTGLLVGRRRSRPCWRHCRGDRASSSGWPGSGARGAPGVAVAWPRAALDGLRADVRFAEPGDDRPGAPQRPLPRLRRSDGVHARRPRCWRRCGAARRARMRQAPCCRARPRGRRCRCAARLEPCQPAAGGPSGPRFPGCRGGGGQDRHGGRRRPTDAPIPARIQVDRGIRLPVGPRRRDRAPRQAPARRHPGERARGHLRCAVRGGDRGTVRRAGRGDGRTAGSLWRADRSVRGRAGSHDLRLSREAD